MSRLCPSRATRRICIYTCSLQVTSNNESRISVLGLGRGPRGPYTALTTSSGPLPPPAFQTPQLKLGPANAAADVSLSCRNTILNPYLLARTFNGSSESLDVDVNHPYYEFNFLAATNLRHNSSRATKPALRFSVRIYLQAHLRTQLMSNGAIQAL